jgi:SpoVK/Ycf46/Vps4 family AAA+-type ATPase
LPEGGCLRFRWQGGLFHVYSVCVWGERQDETYAWIAAPSREQGEALALELALRARREAVRVQIFAGGDWRDGTRLESDLTRHTWSDVILPEEVKERLRRTTERFFRSEGLYRSLDIPWKMGMLFMGPPGTGKSLTTRVIGATCGVRFLYVRGVSSFWNAEPDPSSLNDLFHGARERAPCVLCLEDVEGLLTPALRSAFLNELDGVEQDFRGVLTVATTNHPEKLDPALLYRPSRFDYRFRFPLPDDAVRRRFARHWTERLVRLRIIENPETGLDEVTRRSRGMSQATLKRVMIGAVTRMHHSGERGDEAFLRRLQAELKDARSDLASATESIRDDAPGPGGRRCGFVLDGDEE